MQFAQSKGCKEFSFGWTAKDSQGLLVYKRRWNTTEEDLFSLINDGKRLFHRAQQLLPWPIDRRLGFFLYRHWR
jgi:hypothetical protein